MGYELQIATQRLERARTFAQEAKKEWLETFKHFGISPEEKEAWLRHIQAQKGLCRCQTLYEQVKKDAWKKEVIVAHFLDELKNTIDG